MWEIIFSLFGIKKQHLVTDYVVNRLSYTGPVDVLADSVVQGMKWLKQNESIL